MQQKAKQKKKQPKKQYEEYDCSEAEIYDETPSAPPSSPEGSSAPSVSVMKERFEQQKAQQQQQQQKEQRPRSSSLTSLPTFRTKNLEITVYLKKIEGITDAALNDPTNGEAKAWARTQVMKGEARFTWGSALIKKDNIIKLFEMGQMNSLNDINYVLVSEQQLNKIKTQPITKETTATASANATKKKEKEKTWRS